MNTLEKSEGKEMEKFALIYIGGNTIRYALWQIKADQSYMLLESYREDLKLGQNTHVENVIKQEKIEHLLTILKYFKEFSDSVSADKILIVFSEFFLLEQISFNSKHKMQIFHFNTKHAKCTCRMFF